MLPKDNIATARARAAWTYVPTDELAGDAIGLHMIEDRHLVAYVIDVSGHGVPAALLSVTAMHAMSPAVQAEAILKSPAGVLTELNRRFCASDNDGRFLTMILCVLDTQTGVLRFSRAGHPLPILLRRGEMVTVDGEGGFPLAMVDGGDYADVSVQLAPSDRFHLYSDGIIEQPRPGDQALFREHRLESLVISLRASPGEQVVAKVVEELVGWAGKKSFVDDVTLIAVDWIG
jgi:sigma-B regulation protein RsbU (phosphoserine phosphatase)